MYKCIILYLHFQLLFSGLHLALLKITVMYVIILDFIHLIIVNHQTFHVNVLLRMFVNYKIFEILQPYIELLGANYYVLYLMVLDMLNNV